MLSLIATVLIGGIFPGPAIRPAVALSAQTQPVRRDLPRLREWLSAVDSHEAGRLDASVLAVSSWSRSQLDILFVDVRGLLQLMRGSASPGSVPGVRALTPDEVEQLRMLAMEQVQRGRNRLLKRAALLHTDVALLALAADAAGDSPSSGTGVGEATIAPRTPSVQAADGRHQGFGAGVIHWDMARLLLDAVTPAPSRDETVRLWYAAAAAWFIGQHRFSEAVPHLERALRIFPTDARLLLYSGAVYEIFASPRIQQLFRTAVLPSDVVIAVPSERASLRRAEALYRRALEGDPLLVEARVRLGRVVGSQGRHEDAVRELQRASGMDAESDLLYCAWLFLGHNEAALGHADSAREAFERAGARYPRAQSPYLALSQLARSRGDRATALQAIQPMFALPAAEEARDDPWWHYHDGPGRDVEELLIRARELLQSAGGR